MALSADQIPLTCSLRERVRTRFAPANAADAGEALSHHELVAYLAKSKQADKSPRDTIERRAAKAGRPVVLAPDDHAALAWVTAAFEHWQRDYPLEGPLQEQVRRLLPLAAAMALGEDRFFTPGAHPLHRLLDSLQRGSVGWQVRLDRAGQMLEQRVERSVEKALEWFAEHTHDLSAIERELEAANERDAARAQRMVQRLAETEEARLKTLSARRDAAQGINELLQRFELPAAIGEFLKGPWYDSAQLVLVKYGATSREWQEMLRATRHLIESVQPPASGDEVERDRRAQILRHLPGELRRWLISLEHDNEETDSAIGLVEYAHLRIQHGQVLQLAPVSPLPVEQAEAVAGEEDEPLTSGDWYRFSDDDGELRAQLVLQLEQGQHLLFTNFVGLKALDLSRRAFRQRVHDGFAHPLPNQSTFSLSLATAAGIDSNDALRALMDPTFVPADAAADTPDDAADELPANAPEDREVDDPTEPASGADADSENSLETGGDADDGEREARWAAPTLGQETPAGEAAAAEHPQTPAAEAQPQSPPVAEPSPAREAWEDPDAPPAEQPSLRPEPQTQTSAGSSWPSPTSTGEPASWEQASPGTASDVPPEAPAQWSAGGQEQPDLSPAEDAAQNVPIDIENLELTLDSDESPGPAASAPPPGQAQTFADTTGSSQPDAAPPVSAPSAPQPGAQPPTPPAAAPVPAAPPDSPPPPHAPAWSEPPAAAPPAQEPAPQTSAPAWQQPGAPPAQEPAPRAPAPEWPQPAAAPPPAEEPAPQPGAAAWQQPEASPPPEAPPPQPSSWQQPAAPPPPPPLEATPQSAPARNPAEREIEVPMGAWIGFHDGETPIMAKLAVYDPRRDNYIFVNRKGIALRELNRSELIALMDQGLVDILEARSYFRDEVQRARGEEP